MSSDDRAVHSRRWLILSTVAGCFLPVAADATILNVAVPSLTEALGASARELLWIVDIYPLVMVGLVLVTGLLGDRVGHQRLLLTGLVVFGVSSGLSALATAPAALIAGRAALAVGASMIIPATLAIIRQVFHDPRERALAIGVWSAIAASGAAVGPVAGGLILAHYWWGAVFLINIPLVAVALFLVFSLLTNQVPEDKDPWEAASPVLVVGTVGIVYAVKSAAHQGSAAVETWVPGVIGLAATTLFLRRQLRSEQPMLDLALFREQHFRIGVMAATFPVFVLVGFELQLAQHLQFVIGKSPWEAGIFLLPMPIAAFAAAPLAGLLSSRYGVSVIIPAGLGLAAFGYVGIAISADSGASLALTGCLILIGAGHGGVQAVASDAIMTGAPPNRAGAAASIESVSYEVGAGLGIALLGSLMAAVYSHTFALPPTTEAAVPDKASDSIGEAVSLAHKAQTDVGQAITVAAKEAFIHAYRVTAISAAVIVAVTAVVIALILKRSAPGHGEEEQVSHRSDPMPDSRR